jgi:hypothetical protein
MKKLLILTLFFSTQVFSQSVDGVMDCTVTGNVVVASEEGKFKTYSGFPGGVKANEKLSLNYRVTNNSIYITLKRDQPERNIVIGYGLSTKDLSTTAEKGPNGGFIVSDSTEGHSISFLPDYIRINDLDQFSIRYYKNDWHGIFSSVNTFSSTTQTLTLNCRHTIDKMESAFKIFTVGKGGK